MAGQGATATLYGGYGATTDEVVARSEKPVLVVPGTPRAA
jgi:hypothetical protein